MSFILASFRYFILSATSGDNLSLNFLLKGKSQPVYVFHCSGILKLLGVRGLNSNTPLGGRNRGDKVLIRLVQDIVDK